MSARDNIAPAPALTEVEYDARRAEEARAEAALRDEFAGRAMQGLVAESAVNDQLNENARRTLAALLAESAYLVADAMIRERRRS